jgi:hypothetical protein
MNRGKIIGVLSVAFLLLIVVAFVRSCHTGNDPQGRDDLREDLQSRIMPAAPAPSPVSAAPLPSA